MGSVGRSPLGGEGQVRSKERYTPLRCARLPSGENKGEISPPCDPPLWALMYDIKGLRGTVSYELAYILSYSPPLWIKFLLSASSSHTRGVVSGVRAGPRPSGAALNIPRLIWGPKPQIRQDQRISLGGPQRTYLILSIK